MSNGTETTEHEYKTYGEIAKDTKLNKQRKKEEELKLAERIRQRGYETFEEIAKDTTLTDEQRKKAEEKLAQQAREDSRKKNINAIWNMSKKHEEQIIQLLKENKELKNGMMNMNNQFEEFKRQVQVMFATKVTSGPTVQN